MNQPLDSIATVLESTGDYRVLRRLTPFVDCPDTLDEPTFIGLVLDTETTGTDFATDEVIELGILKFEYGAVGASTGCSRRSTSCTSPKSRSRRRSPA